MIHTSLNYSERKGGYSYICMFGSHSRFSVAVVAVVVDVEANSLRTHQQPGVAKPEPARLRLNLVCRPLGRLYQIEYT